MRWILLTIFASLVCSLGWALDAFREIGAGTQSKGMAGIGIAYPQDALAAAHNPAGMSFVCRRFDMGGDWLWMTGHLRIHNSLVPDANGTYRSSQNFGFPEVGASWVIRPSMTIGLAGYLFGAFDVSYDRAIPGTGTTPVRSRYRSYFITPSWSLLLNPCHAIGVGVNIAIGLARFSGLQGLMPASEHPERVTNQGTDTNAGASVRLGWIGHFCQSFSVGFVYQTRTWMSSFRKYKGLIPDGGNLELPSLIGIGLATFFTPEFVTSVDVEWVFWSDVEAFGNRADSTNPLGSKSGPGLGWNDGVAIKLGAAYQLYSCLIVRAGYNYGRSPIDNHNSSTNFLTLLMPEHHVTVGTTYRRCGHSLSLAYIHGFTQNQSGPRVFSDDDGLLKLRASHDQISISYGRFF